MSVTHLEHLRAPPLAVGAVGDDERHEGHRGAQVERTRDAGLPTPPVRGRENVVWLGVARADEELAE
eukprot:2031999-Prymnesium_polylepis.1